MSPTANLRTVMVAAATLLLMQPAFGQQGGTSGGTPSGGSDQGGATSGGGSLPGVGSIPGGGGTAPGTGRPSQQSPSGQVTDQNNPWQQDMNRPIFLSGRVMVDDGTPPPDTVVIERVCNGVARPEAYTNSKGHFSFELGKNQGMFQDASMSGPMTNDPFGNSGSFGGRSSGMNERDLMGCELRANLPGFRSDMVNLSNRRFLDSPEVGTIILHRMGNVEGRIISATSMNAPKDARKAFDKGQDLVKRKKLDDAAKSLQAAVDLYPKYAAAWLELGKIQASKSQFAEASASYQQAVAADPKFISPYLQLSLLAARDQKWPEVISHTEKALKLDPFDYPEVYYYNAVANLNLQNLDAAETSAREALKMDAERHQYPKVEHLLGVILARRRDYSGAAVQMRNYLRLAPKAQDADQVRSQLQELDRLTGQSASAQPESKP